MKKKYFRAQQEIIDLGHGEIEDIQLSSGAQPDTCDKYCGGYNTSWCTHGQPGNVCSPVGVYCGPYCWPCVSIELDDCPQIRCFSYISNNENPLPYCKLRTADDYCG